MTLFLVDEGCDAIIVRTLRALGCDVEYVAEMSPGIKDAAILHRGLHEQRVIITEDRDFSELVFRDSKPTFGVVLVRIGDEFRERKADQLAVLVRDHIDELVGAMTTVKQTTIKIRPIRQD